MIKSKALESNLAQTQVEVAIDPKYDCLRQIVAQYYGLLERLDTFLLEVSHPLKNWQFILESARGFALDYFHLFKAHSDGPDAIRQLIDIFCQALKADTEEAVKVDAADNLILFLQQIIKAAGAEYQRFLPTVCDTLAFIDDLDDTDLRRFVRSYYGLKPLVRLLAEVMDGGDDTGRLLCRLMVRNLQISQADWLKEPDPLPEFLEEIGIETAPEELEEIFGPIGHAVLNSQRGRLEAMGKDIAADAGSRLPQLLALTDHHEITRSYRRIPKQLYEAGGRSENRNQWKVVFLIQTMNIPGLAMIHEETLHDINRTLSWLIANQQPRYVHNLIQKTFRILEANTRRFPLTAIACVDNMGREIFRTGHSELIAYFIEAVIDLGFQSPGIQGVGNDWQLKVNSAHIQNIRTWMNLIGMQPDQSTRLLSNLIIHLAVSGVFIKDTDLFGRDITAFLNGRIGPVYNLSKQLCRLFPVYFNDIGAEGELRDISTRLDEICHRRDPLVHFLRKQSHVESSSRIIGFMDAILEFWAARDKAPLAPYLPPDIFDRIETQGPYVNGMHAIVRHLRANKAGRPEDLLNQDAAALQGLIGQAEGTPDEDRERVALFAQLYKLLNIKYNLASRNLKPYLDQLSPNAFPKLNRLKNALAEKDLESRTFQLLDYMELLKELILSPRKFEVREDIYKKRHFTVDIPSMYGSYREMKFDAMGLTLRLEALVNTLLDELVNDIDLSLITRATCDLIYGRLMLLNKALRIDGIESAEFEHYLDLLAHSMDIRGFSFTQYLDIYKGLAQAVRNIINDYFNSIHGEHLTRVLSGLSTDQILPRYQPANGPLDDDRLRHRVSEIFLRDRLAFSLGLQQVDLFLGRILNTLHQQANRLPEAILKRLLSYDPQRTFSALADPSEKATGIIYLGNKGLNMLRLHNFGFQVPPGFIITTEVFRCWEVIAHFPPAWENFREQLMTHIRRIEKITGRRFGGSSNPLLLSVRSGSSISQPGMMETYLDVGINPQIAGGLAKSSGNTWFAWDNYRRFLQCYGMALGLQRNDFDEVIAGHKKKWGVLLKREFSGSQMRTVALAYQQRIADAGFRIPEDPMDQLHAAIQAVIVSWGSTKAEAYRRIMGISDDWGTAITIQAMVFGNLSPNAGSGVVFTHNPRWAGDRMALWGDFTAGNQGEDVVAGLVTTMPVSLKQQEVEMRSTDITLETHFPEIYRAMERMAGTLVVEKGWAPQEMEFTFEGPSADQLYLLQTRDMAIREHHEVLTFNPIGKTPDRYLGHGVGVSGGAMSGRLVFTLEEVDHWRKAEPDTHLILVRGDTVPDDIQEIHAADGLLTARGGVTSHASVVAHRLGKTCVVGCDDMVCKETERSVVFNQRELATGDLISIDGREGSVYQGSLTIETT